MLTTHSLLVTVTSFRRPVYSTTAPSSITVRPILRFAILSRRTACFSCHGLSKSAAYSGYRAASVTHNQLPLRSIRMGTITSTDATSKPPAINLPCLTSQTWTSASQKRLRWVTVCESAAYLSFSICSTVPIRPPSKISRVRSTVKHLVPSHSTSRAEKGRSESESSSKHCGELLVNETRA